MNTVDKLLTQVTVVEWPKSLINQFLIFLAHSRYSERTISSYKHHLYTFASVLKKLGKCPDAGYEAIFSSKTFQETLVFQHKAFLVRNKYRRKKFQIAAHLNNYITAWNSFGVWASIHCGIQLFSKVKHLKSGFRLPVAADIKPIINIKIDYSNEEWIYWRNMCMVELMAYSGLRSCEILRLHRSDINFDAQMINVNGKGGYQRHTPVDEMTIKHIRKYLYFLDLQLERENIVNLPYGSALFVSTRGYKSLSQSSLIDGVQSFLYKLTGQVYKLHQLRHACASHYYAKTKDIFAVKSLLGHRSLKSTVIYVRMDPDTLLDMLKKHPRFHRIQSKL